MTTKRENIACRPGTTDAMARLAAENEKLRSDLAKASQDHQYWYKEAERRLEDNEALRVERDGLLLIVKQLREDLRDATQSLFTISAQAGKDDGLMEMIEVRGYAGSRGIVASNALSKIPTQSLAHIKAQGAREALQRARGGKWGFSNTLVAVADIEAAIEQMESGK